MCAITVLNSVVRLTKRICILATNQRSNPPNPVRCDDFQSPCVSVRPRQFLIERRHQLPLMVDNFSLVTDQHSRVPKTTETRRTPLIEPNVRPYIVLRARLLQRTDLRSIDMQTLRGEAVKEQVVVNGSGQCGPEWISSGSWSQT
jgi:hypothetical protein